MARLDDEFTIEKVYAALNTMANERALKLDGKPIEVENYLESELYVPAIKDSMNEMLRTGIVPNALKDVIIVILFKRASTWTAVTIAASARYHTWAKSWNVLF